MGAAGGPLGAGAPFRAVAPEINPGADVEKPEGPGIRLVHLVGSFLLCCVVPRSALRCPTAVIYSVRSRSALCPVSSAPAAGGVSHGLRIVCQWTDRTPCAGASSLPEMSDGRSQAPPIACGASVAGRQRYQNQRPVAGTRSPWHALARRARESGGGRHKAPGTPSGGRATRSDGRATLPTSGVEGAECAERYRAAGLPAPRGAGDTALDAVVAQPTLSVLFIDSPSCRSLPPARGESRSSIPRPQAPARRRRAPARPQLGGGV